jgi:hypothetical protein
VPREQRVDDLRHHRVLVPEDALEQRAAAGEAGEEVAPHFVLDRARAALGVAGRAERAERGGERGRSHEVREGKEC